MGPPNLPTTMKAWQYTTASPSLQADLHLNSSASLPPKSTSLPASSALIRVLTAALNPVDYKIPEAPLVNRLMVPRRPATPGFDYAGRVVAAGSGSGLYEGQLVFGRTDDFAHGTLAEYIVVEEKGAVPVLEGVKGDDAACVGTAGLTAYQSVVPFVKEGESVFVNGGSGGVGVMAIQIAKAKGCEVVVSCSGANVELCKRLGADEVVDYKKEDVVQALKRVGEGKKFDLVVDNVGADGALYYQCHHFTKPGATYVQVGALLKPSAMATLMVKMLLPGFLGGGKRKFSLLAVASKAEDFEQIGKWMQEGKVKAVIDEVYDMEDAVKAYERLKTGRARGKVLVKVNKE